MHNNNSPISSSSDSTGESPKSFFSRDRKRPSKKVGRKRKGMINPSLTYAEYNFLKDLANGKTDDGDDKYSDGYKRLLKHRLRTKFPVVMKMAEMMKKVKEEKKI
jgi:hypothetical protein